MKKVLILAMLLLWPAQFLLAQEPTPESSNAPSGFQQQLQSIQRSMDRPSTSDQPTSTPTPSASANPPPASNVQIPIVPSPGDLNPTPPPAAPAAASAMAAAPAQPAPADLRDEAFLKVTNTLLPLSPAQIQMLRNVYDATQRAAAVFPGVPPRPTSTSLLVDLSPGSVPPVIRLGSGFVTSIVFVDSTGAPWPIDSYSLGNPAAFNIVWDKKGNILLAQAITTHRVGNLAVILKGLNTPVMINLNPGQAAMDVRVELRIPGLGPEAKNTVFSGLPGEQSPFLLDLLAGIPPAGSRVLKASACDGCAWLHQGKLYLRTPYTVISPAWISTLSSADGTHVYELQPTPLVLVTYNGKTIKLKIEGF